MDRDDVLAALKAHPASYLRMVGFERECDVYDESAKMI